MKASSMHIPDADERARIQTIVADHWAAEIESKRAAIENGDGMALLDGIMDVVLSGKPFPEWLSYKVARAIRNYTHHKTTTLDEAFGLARPRGYRRQAMKDRWDNAYKVVHDILHLHRQGVPIDTGMFEVVAKLHRIGKTTAAKWFYFHKRRKTITYLALCLPAPFPENLAAAKLELLARELTVPRSLKKRGITRKR